MNLSDDEENYVKRQNIKKSKKVERKLLGMKAKANKYYVEVDTNVFEIALDCLNNKTEIATGDAEICKGCAGVFNYKSEINASTEGDN